MQFDENFLQEMGLSGMPEGKKQEFLNYVQEKLETKIGERVSNGLSEEQLQEFDNISDSRDIADWLEKNRPDYREIVNQCITEMKDSISKNRDKLIGQTI